MATYTFVCQEHGEFEVTKSMKDIEKFEPCPDCQLMCEQVIKSPPGIHFKGYGWTPKSHRRR